MKSSGIKDFDNYSKDQDNNNERLEWIPVEKINEYDIKPSFLKERITEILESRNVLHIVNETDRK